MRRSRLSPPCPAGQIGGGVHDCEQAARRAKVLVMTKTFEGVMG